LRILRRAGAALTAGDAVTGNALLLSA